MAQFESIHNLKSSLNEEIEYLTNNLNDSIVLLKDISYDLEFISKMTTLLAEESKSASYKYALIRGVIDISFEYTNYIEECNQEEMDNTSEWVCIPMGLMVAKWIDYYYLTYEYEKGFKPVRKKNGNQKPNKTYTAFENIHAIYNRHCADGVNGLTQIKKDLFVVNLKDDTREELINLSKALKDKVIQAINNFGNESKPFLYIKGHSTFSTNDSVIAYLINGYSSIKVEKKFYSCLVKYGRLLLGRDSLLQGWAEYNSKQENIRSDKLQPLSYHLELLTRESESESNTQIAKSYLRTIKSNMADRFVCVWSKNNKELQDEIYEVDHIIPFSVSSNNDLWNLLPCSPTINKDKSNMIPLNQLKQDYVKNRIICYWLEYLNCDESKSEFISCVKNAFQVEIESGDNSDNKLESVYEKLINWCEFLVDVCNHKQWNY